MIQLSYSNFLHYLIVELSVLTPSFLKGPDCGINHLQKVFPLHQISTLSNLLKINLITFLLNSSLYESISSPNPFSVSKN